MSTARMIDQTYVKTGQVRVVVKNFSASDNLAGLAAQASFCAADQGKFWEYHDKLMESAYVVDRAVFSPAGYRQVAADLGLDGEAFGACLDSGKYAQRVDQETAEARILGVTGTPTFFINGAKIVGAQPFAVFQAAIEQALKAK